MTRRASTFQRLFLGAPLGGWQSLANTISTPLLCIALRIGAAQGFGYIELGEDSVPETTQ